MEDKGKTNVTLEIETDLPPSIFDHNLRENIIAHIKANFQSRCYYMYYIDVIDCTPLLENELPLIVPHGDVFKMRINLDVTIVNFNVGDTVSLSLIIDKDDDLNVTTVFGENEFISCKIDLNSRQIIEAGHKETISLKDTVYNRVYNPGDSVEVKITSFLNNQTDTGFSTRLNCEGTIV